jgi:hypothetical protein
MMFVPKKRKAHTPSIAGAWACGKTNLVCRYAMLSPAPEGANRQHVQQQPMQQQHMPTTLGRD